MTVNFFPVKSSLQAQHDVGLRVGKELTEGKPKQDQLRDPRKSETECIDWTSNGERILVCSRDGTLKMWRADRLFEERAWTGSWTWVESHPTDPNIFCAVSWDGKLKIVDVRNPSAANDIDLKKIKGDKYEKFLHVSWRLDGSAVSILTRSDIVHVVEVDSLNSVSIQPGGEVYSTVFDRFDRLWVATGGSPGKILVYTGSESEEIFAHSQTTSCLARAKDYIISGGGDALVAVWDVENLCCIFTLPESVAPVTTISSNFDGSLVAWGSGQIGAREGESILSLGGIHSGKHYASHAVTAPVSRVKWHPTKNILAYSLQQSSSSDGGVFLVSFPDI
jgi:THO complex subunit 3